MLELALGYLTLFRLLENVAVVKREELNTAGAELMSSSKQELLAQDFCHVRGRWAQNLIQFSPRNHLLSFI